MADKAAEPEPSMEEILEMIRRNITEEGRARAARIFGGRGNRGSPGILDLTEAVADDGTVRHVAPIAAEGRGEPVPIVAAAERAGGDDRLDREVRLGTGARTLEDVVGDLLRPMLQAWLDDNLPGLVERLARAELARRSGD